MKKTLRRSNERMILGVCGGLAEYFDWDPTLVRLGYVLLSFFFLAFPGILAYFIFAIIMPPAFPD